VNDPNQPSFDPSGLELDRPPPRQASPSPPKPTTVRSAARERPLAPEPKKKLDKAALKEGAIDTLLNSVSILSEIIEDFRSSDRFFKYKASVIAVWALLVLSSVGVACGDQRGPTNDIQAALIVGGDTSRPVYLIKNESNELWQDVIVLVNGKYRATLAQIDANGGSFTISPAVLFDESGAKAPSTLTIADIVITVSEPAESVTLLKGGLPFK
jgi:hypothetical protein